jgi:hypothetical protein
MANIMIKLGLLGLVATTGAGVAVAKPRGGDGYKRLTTEWRGDDQCLDIINDGRRNNQPILAACELVGGQHWKVTPPRGGSVKLTTEWRRDGMCLDVANDGTSVRLTSCRNSTGQRWKLWDVGNGFTALTTEVRGVAMCLDIANDGAANNQPILARCDNVSGQHWRVTSAD